MKRVSLIAMLIFTFVLVGCGGKKFVTFDNNCGQVVDVHKGSTNEVIAQLESKSDSTIQLLEPGSYEYYATDLSNTVVWDQTITVTGKGFQDVKVCGT